jgi:hypothetical protein
MPCRLVLYHLSQATSLWFGYFWDSVWLYAQADLDHDPPVYVSLHSWDDMSAFGWDGVLWTFCQGWRWTPILSISTSQIAGIKALSHHTQLYLFLESWRKAKERLEAEKSKQFTVWPYSNQMSSACPHYSPMRHPNSGNPYISWDLLTILTAHFLIRVFYNTQEGESQTQSLHLTVAMVPFSYKAC